MKRWLLAFGSEVEVTEPQHLRRAMAEELAKALQEYAR
jgi:predicted DNA-binding transcriptional regulator YafY